VVTEVIVTCPMVLRFMLYIVVQVGGDENAMCLLLEFAWFELNNVHSSLTGELNKSSLSILISIKTSRV
jgi:hypothetical protein